MVEGGESETPGGSDDAELYGFVGTGRVGTAVADILTSSGRRVARVFDVNSDAMNKASQVANAAAAVSAAEVARECDVIFVTTPDDCIEETCGRIADSGVDLRGKVFVHMSGALSVTALDPVTKKGARALCAHPMQTFADLEGVLRSLPGSTFGVTCDPEMEQWARHLVRDLEGTVTMVRDDDKVLYHAAAVVACNLLVMIEYGAQELFAGLGLPREEALAAFMPLARSTLYNVERLGPADALTGPLARGDLGTIAAHLEALEKSEPEIAFLYRGVSLWGLRLVAERGGLQEERIEEMRRLLLRHAIPASGEFPITDGKDQDE